jgi:serine/threonine protein kinase
MMHRDVKPSSLLVDRAGRLSVTNLGNLRVLARTGAKAGSVVGTRCYHAPERIVAVGFDRSVDVWGLGLTLLEAALGRYPFADLQHNYIALLEHIVACPCPVDQLPAAAPAPGGPGGPGGAAGFSAGFRGVLRGCLQKQARERPTAVQLLGDPLVAGLDRPAAQRALVRAAGRCGERFAAVEEGDAGAAWGAR